MSKLYFLAIQSTYQEVECALFDEKECLEQHVITKFKSAEQTIPVIDILLTKYNIPLHNLSFIAVNQGPAPFTTLRIVLSTVNGLSFASSTPLVGVDGLKTLLQENKNQDGTTIALLNAFGQDVYYAFECPFSGIQKGYENIEYFINRLCSFKLPQPFYFIGNGSQLYKSIIQTKVANYTKNFRVITHGSLFCSLKQIGHVALQQWKRKEPILYKLLPLYTKIMYKN